MSYKILLVLRALDEVGGKANASALLAYMNMRFPTRKVLRTFNSVNAALAYCAQLQLVNRFWVGEENFGRFAVYENIKLI